MGISDLNRQFQALNKAVWAFCDAHAKTMGCSKIIPAIGSDMPYVRPRTKSAVAKPVYEFGSSEDYIFFTLLSIINTQLYDRIFCPFHPADVPTENQRHAKEYEWRRNNGVLPAINSRWLTALMIIIFRAPTEGNGMAQEDVSFN